MELDFGTCYENSEYAQTFQMVSSMLTKKFKHFQPSNYRKPIKMVEQKNFLAQNVKKNTLKVNFMVNWVLV